MAQVVSICSSAVLTGREYYWARVKSTVQLSCLPLLQALELSPAWSGVLWPTLLVHGCLIAFCQALASSSPSVRTSSSEFWVFISWYIRKTHESSAISVTLTTWCIIFLRLTGGPISATSHSSRLPMGDEGPFLGRGTSAPARHSLKMTTATTFPA